MVNDPHTSVFYPGWVERLALPVWVSSNRGLLCFMNVHAESLLGVAAREVLGSPCHHVIRGADDSHRAFCSRFCPVRNDLETMGHSNPVRLRLGGSPHDTWVLLLTIPVGSTPGDWSCLVHCAVPCEREHRIEDYLKHLAQRAHPAATLHDCAICETLTPREQGVLEEIVAGRCLREASEELHVSYSTVRNHMQHILAKLGAHSIQEAVALWLLREVPEDADRGEDHPP